MKFSKAILAGVLGTTGMTIFSYYLSKKKDRNFREPALLASMIKSVAPPAVKTYAPFAGWLTHYLVGLLFALVYQSLLKRKSIQHHLVVKLMIGGLSGILAVAVWKTGFSVHPHPPRINYKRFYGQLIIAHIIFGTITIFFLDLDNKDNLTIHSKQINNC